MKRLLLLAGCVIPSLAMAQSVPDWKSYTQTGNPADIVPSAGTSNSVAAWLGNKVDVTNGSAAGLSVTGGAIDPTTTLAGNPASSLLHVDTSNNLTLPGALATPYSAFAAPQSGSSLGVGAQTYLAPNPVVQGSLSVQGNAPIVHLHSFLNPNPFDIWEDASGNGNMSCNSPTSCAINLFAHEFNLGGSTGGVVANFYGGPAGSNPFSIWQGADGQAWLSNTSASANTYYNININAGNAWIVMDSEVQYESSSSFTTNTALCGSISGAKGCIIFRDPNGTQSYAPYFQ